MFIVIGIIIIADIIKEDALGSIKQLKSMGIKKTIMLTGDHSNVAQKVGETLEMDEVYSQLLPHEKLEKLEQLDGQKSTGKKIIFAGDGINDAPVLAWADIEIGRAHV